MDFMTEIVAGVHLVESRYGGGPLENPNLPLNAPEIWEAVFSDSRSTHTGESITPKKAISYAPVWQAITLISGDIAKLPLNLYQKRPEIGINAREQLIGDPAGDLVNKSPNPEQSAIKFWRRFMVHGLLWNNGWAWIERDDMGEPVGLYHLLPDRTRYERIGGRLYAITEIGESGRLKAIPSDDVLHIEGIAFDLAGCDLLDCARNSWALGLAQEKFSAKFFRFGGRIGGILELPIGMPKGARDQAEEGFRKSYEGVDNPFKTVILRDSAKFHAAQVTPADSQLVDAGEQQVRNVARWFNLAPSKLGLSDSVSYNSKTEDNQAYLDSTLAIWLQQIASECNLKLLTPKQRKKYFFEHDTSHLLRMNQLARYQSYQIGLASLFLSPNEVRAQENLLPYDGGDVYVNPNTTAPAPALARGHNLRRVVFALADHARVKAKSGKAFVEWIDGGLASHRERAKALLGNDTIVEGILVELRALAGCTAEAGLAGAVDNCVSRFEREC